MSNSYTVIINVRDVKSIYFGAIKQIEKQTIKPDQIVIFDNASIDKTPRLIRKLVIRNSKFYISSKSIKPITLYKARNLAIKLVKTKYVCFLDVDDLWNENKSEKQLEILKRNKDAIACLTEFEKVFEYKFNCFKYSNELCKIEIQMNQIFFFSVKKI